ncbi:hypothetical protein PU629_07430 [Pullulanibacillus sp. KACC 23026]|uniref:hypothetical protein n=1 Tax=Pullulanibacillus sp. KACC 23026 TaxID=3028315 RepID=UPI0023B07C46|nr:hypothetical protein [Pullulanibacillus sp. KACC 23026]WEG14189.1 hypothetical protein PU629_07430 [Pullulanibacillus sp. KACC 23026]
MRDLNSGLPSTGSMGRIVASRSTSKISDDVNELAHDELVSHDYLRGLIARSRDKEQLGRILHYLDHNNTANLSHNQFMELRSLVFDRFKDMKLAELLSHLDLIIMHFF